MSPKPATGRVAAEESVWTGSSEKQSWVEHALARLSEAGYRRGGSRNKVVDLLAKQDCAITPLELDNSLEGVGRASVYRAIEQLEELGLVQRIDLGGESTAYERVDPRGHHHHHLVCNSCGRVIPFEDEQLERAVHRISFRDDFDIESHDITLRGICSSCD